MLRGPAVNAIPLLATLLLLIHPALAQPALLQPTSAPFNDRLTDRVPVGGRTLVGVVATPGVWPLQDVGLTSGALALAAASDSPVCVRATTQDGRYVAENAYLPTGGIRRLAWPSSYAAVLQSIPLREVAVLATAGLCSARGGAVLPIAVGQSGTDVQRGQTVSVQVLANTHGAPTWAVLRDLDADGGPALRRVRCARLEDGARVAFDARCSVGDLPRSRLELRLEQQGRDGRSMEVVERTLLGPAE